MMSTQNGSLTLMNNKESQLEEFALAPEELELERERAADPFRPFALVLLDIAAEKLAREKERRESKSRPAPRSKRARP